MDPPAKALHFALLNEEQVELAPLAEQKLVEVDVPVTEQLPLPPDLVVHDAPPFEEHVDWPKTLQPMLFAPPAEQASPLP